MSNIPMRSSDVYPQWVRQNALVAVAQVVAAQVDEHTHKTVVVAKMEALIPWAERYLKTGGFPPREQ